MKTRGTGVFGSRPAVAITSVIVTAVVLMGGVALATVGDNSVTSAKIRNGAVKSVDIGNGQVKSADIATGGVRSVDIGDGTIQPKDVNHLLRPRWARVGADGATLAGRGVTSTSKNVAPAGIGVRFRVVFASSIANCGWTATLNSMNTDAVTNDTPDGEISVRRIDTKTLEVRIKDSSGGLVIPSGNEGFTVQAVC